MTQGKRGHTPPLHFLPDFTILYTVKFPKTVILLYSVALILPALTVEQLCHVNNLLTAEDVTLLKNVILALVAMLHVP